MSCQTTGICDPQTTGIVQVTTSQSDVDLVRVAGAALSGQRRLSERQVIAPQLELVEVHSHRRLHRCWQCLARGPNRDGLKSYHQQFEWEE